VEVRSEKIGPERAEQLLAGQRNRHLSREHGLKIARDMASGDWRPNSVIQIASVNGEEVLIDGQHRLYAVTLTGTPQEFVVIYGLTLDDQQVIDTGRKRTLSDVLALQGETRTTILGAAIGYYWRRQRGQFTSHLMPTAAEGLVVLREHPGLRDSIGSTHLASRALKMPGGLCCCLHYEMAALDRDSADQFWQSLARGTSLHERHPVYVLRQRMEKNIISVAKLDGPMIHALIIKAWNAYILGEEITFVRWTRGGATPEPFPLLRSPQ